MWRLCHLSEYIGCGKCKSRVLPYSLPSDGPRADPGVQTVSPQVTSRHPAVGCHYCGGGLAQLVATLVRSTKLLYAGPG